MYLFNIHQTTKKSFLVSLCFALAFMAVAPCIHAQEEDEEGLPAILYGIDLTSAENDEIPVTINVPEGYFTTDPKTATLMFPRTIPGTYEFYNYGRFVKKVVGKDVKGEELTIERVDANTFKIKGKNAIKQLSYSVEDTWDSDSQGKVIFEPAGTNFETKKNFVINYAGVLGFFKGYEKNPCNISIDRPVEFFGATPLYKTGGDTDTDEFEAINYHELMDSPVMYCLPDTAVMRLGLTKVEISVYSATKKITAKDILVGLKPLLEAQLTYLNYIIPTERYTFIFYFSDKQYKSQSLGALEHSRCSMFCLPDEKPERIMKTVREISAHEFFHCITPLYIHSEEIQYFNYENPKMSKHLWLYEGVVEYLSLHVLAESGMVDFPKFVDKMREKMENADLYKSDVAFTTLSTSAFDAEFSEEYLNVYEKGALIGMCLDLLLIEQSDGAYNLRLLLRDLSRQFGQEKPFKDEELFNKIVELSGGKSKVRDFLNNCVAGAQPLPFAELFAKIGLEYKSEGVISELSPLGGIDNGVLKSVDGKKEQFFIAKPEKLDEFGLKFIKFEKGDILYSWNGELFTPKNISKVFSVYAETAKAGDELTVIVKRADATGALQDVTLKTTLQNIDVKHKHMISDAATISPQSLKLRKAYMGKKG